MNILSAELKQRMEKACKDAVWTEKVRAAVTWDEYAKFLAEKSIEAPEDLKVAFESGKSRKTGELPDDELEKVSGGFGTPISCVHEYHYIHCDLLNCPNYYLSWRNDHPEDVAAFCSLGYWGNRYDNAYNDDNYTVRRRG